MIFAYEIPDLAGAHPIRGHLVSIMLGPQCQSYAGRAMLTSFVRFVEMAGQQYRFGRSAALEFFANSSNLYGLFDGSSGFEACVGYMHRAIRCMHAIRSREQTADVAKALFVKRPPFMADSIQKKIRDIRDAAHHSYERVFDGRISEGTPFILALGGTELSTPSPDNPNQVTKTWDRIEIGPHQIMFSELSEWLAQMVSAAEAIVAYRPAVAPE